MSDSKNRENEVDLLSALLAFREDRISAEILRKAVGEYANSSSKSLCAVIESLTDVEFAEFARCARKHLDGAISDSADATESTQATWSAPAYRSEAEEDEQDAEQQDLDTPEWGQASEFWSHIYYTDDVVRSYTAGWLGLTSTVCILGALFALAWAAVSLPLFGTSDSPLPTTRTAATAQPVAPASSDAGDTAASDVGDTAESSDSKTMATSDDPPQSKASASDAASPVRLASKNKNAPGEQTSRGDNPLVIPVDLDPVVDLIDSGDLPSALRLLEEIQTKTGAHNTTCDRMAIGILLESGTVANLREAAIRVKRMEEVDSPISKLLFCRWAMKASSSQRLEVYEHFRQAGTQSLATNWLASLCGDPEEAIEELRKNAAGSEDVPSNIFLATAYYFSGSRKDALAQLDAVDQALKQPNSWFAADRAERWLIASSVAAIASGATRLREQLELPR